MQVRPTLVVALAAAVTGAVAIGGTVAALAPRDEVKVVSEVEPIQVTPDPAPPVEEQPSAPGPAPVQPAPPADIDDDDDDDDDDDGGDD